MPVFHDGMVVALDRPPSELIVRVRELRRRMLGPAASKEPETRSLQHQIEDLRAQVAHLEQLVQGLQDSVYRDARRQDDQIAELQERTAPEAIAAALSQDARERGL